MGRNIPQTERDVARHQRNVLRGEQVSTLKRARRAEAQVEALLAIIEEHGDDRLLELADEVIAR